MLHLKRLNNKFIPMKTFKEFSHISEVLEKENDISLNEDRLQKELISYCNTITKRMEQRDWRKALGDAKNLVKILEMVI